MALHAEHNGRDSDRSLGHRRSVSRSAVLVIGVLLAVAFASAARAADPAPPVLTSPVGGAVVSGGSVVVAGTAPAGSAVAISAGGTLLGSGVADASGSFSIAVPVAPGRYTLTAVDTVNGVSSPSSTPVDILVQPAAPTRVDECKHGGYRNYPQFKNQGQCVSYVQHLRN